ncbi:Asp-tRNA(Asn)/Glu-tRNA(Gln) amidotransferase subunit GatC [Porticoccus sp. W117]|uniref:Asp-tRNA(Asn)/Glu-tRNA(Gln) amidotransferase subunit GatC n=1 Tax=Porticoccus sp. W117 TaxID=3054777 RepID=UPI00259592B5|nr:Asp-tRNA(Asn)/Glu-tRNA(Gln) amidotransferase subunit GatC [Porticoccus sp. W117]MDM3871728.1 Asp-tRNA(Asn)/Glu-tRNA(Gln) amidotransferase subunit GatC [Porticoccus sp. W117]
MSIEQKDIAKVATLARLAISTEEIDDTTDRINKVLNLVDQLQAADTDSIAPMAHPLDAVQRLRADSVTETNNRDGFQAIAPATEDGLYLVPKVID